MGKGRQRSCVPEEPAGGTQGQCNRKLLRGRASRAQMKMVATLQKRQPLDEKRDEELIPIKGYVGFALRQC